MLAITSHLPHLIAYTIVGTATGLEGTGPGEPGSTATPAPAESFQVAYAADGAVEIKLDLPPFTLVGATTRAGLLTSPLRDRFGIVQRLEFYSVPDLARIVARSAGILGVPSDAEGALRIAGRQEIEAALTEQGRVEVVCEFCGRQYLFAAAEARALFAPQGDAQVTRH